MNVAVMGYGTIGSGVVEILRVNADIIAKRAGVPLKVTKVLDLRDFGDDPISSLIVHDYKEIADDPDIDIVVETMGGVEPAYTFVKAMLESGKHVTTSNKALVADKGAELIRIAREHEVNFLFEASVGGGIPIIRVLDKCLTGDVVEEITGIVNGTTNFMMTKMTDEGSEFDDVLKEAQSLGYAEKDPTADIEGHDACRKIAILTSLVSGAQVDYQDIPTEGISHISATDIKYAAAMGRKIKLLASSKVIGDTYYCRVAPYLLPPEHPLFNVEGVFNAVFVRGNMLGDSMYYGSGAGKLPTASAVVGDIVEMAKHVHMNVYLEWHEEKLTLADPKAQSFRNFVRTSADRSEIESIFSDLQFVDAGISGETGFVTAELTESEMDEKLGKLGDKVLSRIRLG